MVFPSKCTHLNFKLSIFCYCNSLLSLKGEASDPLIYPFPSSTPSPPHLWNSRPLYILRLRLELNLTIPCWCFKTNVHLWVPFSCVSVVCFLSRGAQAARGVADTVTQWQWPLCLGILMNWDGDRGVIMAPQRLLLPDHVWPMLDRKYTRVGPR